MSRTLKFTSGLNIPYENNFTMTIEMNDEMKTITQDDKGIHSIDMLSVSVGDDILLMIRIYQKMKS